MSWPSFFFFFFFYRLLCLEKKASRGHLPSCSDAHFTYLADDTRQYFVPWMLKSSKQKASEQRARARRWTIEASEREKKKTGEMPLVARRLFWKKRSQSQKKQMPTVLLSARSLVEMTEKRESKGGWSSRAVKEEHAKALSCLLALCFEVGRRRVSSSLTKKR